MICADDEFLMLKILPPFLYSHQQSQKFFIIYREMFMLFPQCFAQEGYWLPFFASIQPQYHLSMHLSQ
jgi:hypothetical protein